LTVLTTLLLRGYR